MNTFIQNDNSTKTNFTLSKIFIFKLILFFKNEGIMVYLT